MLSLIAALILTYLIGSIPTAYIFGRIIKGIDIRNFGSGNVGATNVYRLIGKVPAFIVLFIDALKGFAPVLLFPAIFNIDKNLLNPELTSILIGVACISGHVWMVFLKFKGGKGVATTSGVMLAIAPKVFLIALIVWVIIFLLFRYVSLASITAAISLPIASLVMNKAFPLVLFSITICFIGTYKHKSNISRLLKGEEKKLL